MDSWEQEQDASKNRAQGEMGGEALCCLITVIQAKQLHRATTRGQTVCVKMLAVEETL